VARDHLYRNSAAFPESRTAMRSGASHFPRSRFSFLPFVPFYLHLHPSPGAVSSVPTSLSYPPPAHPRYLLLRACNERRWVGSGRIWTDSRFYALLRYFPVLYRCCTNPFIRLLFYSLSLSLIFIPLAPPWRQCRTDIPPRSVTFYTLYGIFYYPRLVLPSCFPCLSFLGAPRGRSLASRGRIRIDSPRRYRADIYRPLDGDVKYQIVLGLSIVSI